MTVVPNMRTVQMTLDRELVESVDGAVKQLGTTRSAFTRRALTDALERLRVKELEERHRRGYERRPVRRGEFAEWEREHRTVRAAESPSRRGSGRGAGR